MTMLFVVAVVRFIPCLFHKETELHWELLYLNDAAADTICVFSTFCHLLSPGSSGCVEHVLHTRTFIHSSLCYC
jgi:hypothetical protein